MDPTMQPPAPPQPGDQQDALRRALGLSIMPQQEQWLLSKLGLGRQLFGGQPHQVKGAGPGIAWGLADAARMMLGAHMENQSQQGLFDLAQKKLKARQDFMEGMQDPTANVPEHLVSDEAKQAGAARMRSFAMNAAATGDEPLQAAGAASLKQQQVDREYAALAQQVAYQKAELDLSKKKESHAETEREFGRGHTLRTEHEWETKYDKEMGGYLTTSKHTGETWMQREGEEPVLLFKGRVPGGGKGPLTPGSPGPAAAAPPGDGDPGAAALPGGGGGPPGTSNPPLDLQTSGVPGRPPYVHMGSEQAQGAVRTSAGVTGLGDALAAGFPTNSRLKSIGQSLAWKGAEHGYPQLTGANDQQRVAAWDAVFDPLARTRAGLRIPEEQMARMRMELRPNPGESWDVHMSKVKRIIDTFRAEAANLPPPRSRAVFDELDQIEAQLPQSKADYEAFNKRVVQSMEAKRAGKKAPQSVTVAPGLRRAAPKGPNRQPPLQERINSYYQGAEE